ncbi:MAG: sigma-54 dependent transcriptional regulator, partial [Pseudomonadota bacterium]
AHGLVKAMSAGAYSFIEKPFDPHRLMTVLRNAAQKHRLTRDAARLRERLAHLSGLDQILLGAAASIATMKEEVIDLAPLKTPVMLLGETGTGKELVASALHDLSDRAGAPFVAMNCASLPIAEFEREMFGAIDGPVGAMARAEGGTLFLDELGAFPMEAQAKLLRVIETREFTPIGTSEPQSADIRFLSASNEPLETAMSEGRFREDLFYRLGAVIIRMPPLRERREDVPLLYHHFSRHYARLYEISEPELGAEDMAAMMSHDWPGNVRELRHVAERRILAAKRGRGSVTEAIGRDDDVSNVPETLREAVAAFERQLIGQALRTHGGRMDAVAEALGIGRRTLNEKIVKLGLNKAEHI